MCSEETEFTRIKPNDPDILTDEEAKHIYIIKYITYMKSIHTLIYYYENYCFRIKNNNVYFVKIPIFLSNCS